MTTRKMRVLYFAPKECWPTTTGALVRNYHLARALARTAEVTYLSFSDRLEPNGDQQAAEALAWTTRLIHVPQERPYTPLKLARGALGNTPVTVLNYTSALMAEEIKRVLAAQDFDVMQIESVHLSAYLPLFRAARNKPFLVCDWHNIESDLMRQYSMREARPLRRLYARKTARQMSVLEREVAAAVDLNLMVSEPDLDRLRSFAPKAPAVVIENGVDCNHFTDEQIVRAYEAWRNSSARPGNGNRNRVLFVGSMDYHANVEGIVSFARNAWARMRELLPEATLTIAGRNPRPEVRALSDLPNVEVTGTVPDMRPYYREALVSIVPLNVGGGSRLKICEAMAAGVPVISTRLGAEGIQVRDGENILFAETADEFCRKVSEVCESETQWRKLALAGRELAHAKYDWAALGDALADRYGRLIQDRD